MKPFAALAALIVLVSGSALPAQEKPAADGAIVELPRFLVTDSRELPPLESWRYATIPDFVK